MKIFKNLFALLVLAAAFTACEKDVMINEPQADAQVKELQIDQQAHTGDQGQVKDERDRPGA
ncbi:MAG: hypothetical protein CR985_00650 [Flavobacteriales bacterium]|nr:MAG: hypothetical protein CR985_00650 [Flavobacteriales bacterium]